MTTPFLDLANICQRLESTTGRKEKVGILSGFLRHLEEEELGTAVGIMLGRPLPRKEGPLEVGDAALGRLWKEGQTLLFEEEVTLPEVLPLLRKVARATGSGSRRKKERLLQNLLGRMSDLERRYLMRSLFGEMRIGVNEGMMLEGISEASGIPLDGIRNAFMVTGDLGEVARAAIVQGSVDDMEAAIFTPIQPMLAEVASSVQEALSPMGEAGVEFKLDGIRVQVHRQGDDVRLYSRRMTEITQALPEVVSMMREDLEEDGVVLEGEVIAFRGRPLPFQDLMRRFRVHDVEESMERVPVRLFLFDVLVRGRRSVMDLPYRERWALLESTVPSGYLVPRTLTDEVEEAEDIFQRALEGGHEGVMVKDLDGIYTAGKRGGRWLKVKRSYTLDLVIVAAEWGHGRRRGWLSDYHLAAVTDGGLAPVGKTYKGLSDQEFQWMTERLLGIKIGEDRVVEVRPEVVVEVLFDEIQESPHYPSGLALRFARIRSIREDLGPEQAGTLEELRRLYREQFRTKGRLKG
ncbi:MAG: ATP-dependent DNA ligase [Methanomassiliicoccales archaeon]